MTRQAEPLTITVDDEPAIWAPRGTFLGSGEARPVLPEHFVAWYASERLKVASRLARWLRITSGPMPISTALWLAVHLSLRGTELRRRWVAFSICEERFLKQLRLPGAEMQPGLEDGVVRFLFSEDEPPLRTLESLSLVPCEEMSPLHYFPQRGASGRQITLPQGEG